MVVMMRTMTMIIEIYEMYDTMIILDMKVESVKS